mmetsp:Transcript_41004/g.131109  ORF Transcript_41004/g.131109 Transcript_41004/m.131109 type:complete len:120 (+) Transcript_41004:163-522(+)
MGPKKADEPEVTRKFKGLYQNMGMWRARIWSEGGEVYLGHYDSQEAAGGAYDRAAVRLRGLDEAIKDGLNNPAKWMALKTDSADVAVQQDLDAMLSMQWPECLEYIRKDANKIKDRTIP